MSTWMILRSGMKHHIRPRTEQELRRTQDEDVRGLSRTSARAGSGRQVSLCLGIYCGEEHVCGAD